MIWVLLICGAAISAQGAFTAWLVKQASDKPPRPSENPPENFGDWRHPESWWAETYPEIRDAGLEIERQEKAKQPKDPVSFGYEGRSLQKYSGQSASLGGSFKTWKPKQAETEKDITEPDD